jgi:hypothetical protein
MVLPSIWSHPQLMRNRALSLSLLTVGLSLSSLAHARLYQRDIHIITSDYDLVDTTYIDRGRLNGVKVGDKFQVKFPDGKLATQVVVTGVFERMASVKIVDSWLLKDGQTGEFKQRPMVVALERTRRRPAPDIKIGGAAKAASVNVTAANGPAAVAPPAKATASAAPAAPATGLAPGPDAGGLPSTPDGLPAAGGAAGPDGGLPPAPEGGLPPAPGAAPDAGLPPAPGAAPDASLPPAPGAAPDAGLPPAPGAAPDAGLPPAPDAGLPPAPDAGLPPAPAGSPPGDPGLPPM